MLDFKLFVIVTSHMCTRVVADIFYFFFFCLDFLSAVTGNFIGCKRVKGFPNQHLTEGISKEHLPANDLLL